MKLKTSLFFFLFVAALHNSSFSQGKGYNDISDEDYNNLTVSVVNYNGTKPETFTSWGSSIVPEVGDQGRESSCNAWGLGYACMTMTIAEKNNWDIYDSGGKMNSARIFSPAYLYNSLNGGKDNGTNILQMLEFVKTTGIVPWEDFPYIEGDYAKKPGDDLKKVAGNYRISDYARIDMNEEAIKSHLLSGYPVVIAIMAYKGMTEGGSEAYKNKTPFFFEEFTSDKAEGKHCVCIIGYDDTIETPNGKGAFLVQNSWGQDWGTNGRFFMPYDVFGKEIPGTKTPYIVHGFVVKM